MKNVIATVALAAAAPLLMSTPSLTAEPATPIASTTAPDGHSFGPMAVVFVRLAMAAAAAGATKSTLPNVYDGPESPLAFD